MARSWFGDSTADFVVEVAAQAGAPIRYVDGTMTVWDAETGGTQYTDLLVNSVAATTVPVRAGQYRFQGPDGVVSVWAEVDGGDRVLVTALGDVVAQASASADLAAAYAASINPDLFPSRNDGTLGQSPVIGDAGDWRFTDHIRIDARDYGVVGNNSHADHAAIQAALDAAEAAAVAAAAFTGGQASVIVVLPPGWFKVGLPASPGTALTIASNVWLVGQGDATVLLLTGTSNANVIQNKNYGTTGTLDRNIRVLHMRIHGNQANQSATLCPQGYVTADTAISSSGTTTLPVDDTTGFPNTGADLAWVGNVAVSYTGKTSTSLTGVQMLTAGTITRKAGAWVTPYASKGHLVAIQGTRCQVAIRGEQASGSGIYFQGIPTVTISIQAAENRILQEARIDNTCRRFGIEIGVLATDGYIDKAVAGGQMGGIVVRGADWVLDAPHIIGVAETMSVIPVGIIVADSSCRITAPIFDTCPHTSIWVDATINDQSQIIGPSVSQAQLFGCSTASAAGGHGVVYRGHGSGTTRFDRSAYTDFTMWSPIGYGFSNAPWTRTVTSQNLAALAGNKLQVRSCTDFWPTSAIGGSIQTSTDVLTYTGRQMSNTRLTTAAAIGDTTLTVESTTGFDSSGTATLMCFDGLTYTSVTFTYTGKTATTFTGIPASSTGSITTASPIGTQAGGVSQHFFTGVSAGLLTRGDGSSVFAPNGGGLLAEVRETAIVYRSFQVGRHNYGASDAWTQSNGMTGGKPMKSSGTLSVAAGTLTATAAHGMAEAPTLKELTPTADTQGRRYWMTASSTNVTVTLDANATTNPITFDWRAEITT